MNDDAELLRRFAAERAEDAFAEFVQRHIGLVHGAALRRLNGDAHGAADVAQQVFIAAARHSRQLARHPEILGWLHATTRHAALDFMRTERRRRLRETAAHAEAASGRGGNAPEAATDWATVRPVIDGALEELGASDREAILLRFFEARSFADVGRRFHLTENAARMRVERALDKLHALLARRGVSSSAAALGIALAHEAAAATAAVPAALTASVTGTALAGAGALAPAAISLSVMSTNKILAGVTIVLGVAGLSTAIYQALDARESRAALAKATGEHGQALEAVDRFKREAQALADTLAARDRQLAELQARVKATPAPARPTTGTVTAAAANPGFEAWADPNYARLSTQKAKTEMALRYGPLYRKLGLTPEQIATFEANRTAFEQATMDVWSSAVAQGVSVRDPALSKLATETAGTLDRELRALLGAEGHAQFRNYAGARQAVDFVGSLAGNLYYTDIPLSAAQGQRLIDLVVTHTRTVPSAADPRVRQYTTDWNALSADARGVLAAGQLPVLEAMLKARTLQQQMGELTKKAQGAPAPAQPSSKG